jgi:hypothetical protein
MNVMVPGVDPGDPGSISADDGVMLLLYRFASMSMGKLDERFTSSWSTIKCPLFVFIKGNVRSTKAGGAETNSS